MKYTNELAQIYLNKHVNKWSTATLRSERARLLTLIPLIQSTPEVFWKSLYLYKPYTKITIYSRAVDFIEWCHKFTQTPYDTSFKDWREENAQLFKNQYVPRKVPITYEQALEAINTIPNESIKEKCIELLSTAQRWFESIQEPQEGTIIGKGGRRRNDLRDGRRTIKDPGYQATYRALKKIGLSPHLLRKLALTRAAENGAQPADLMAIAGWSSIQSASFYLQPKTQERLKGFLK